MARGKREGVEVGQPLARGRRRRAAVVAIRDASYLAQVLGPAAAADLPGGELEAGLLALAVAYEVDIRDAR